MRPLRLMHLGCVEKLPLTASQTELCLLGLYPFRCPDCGDLRPAPTDQKLGEFRRAAYGCS